MINLGEVSRSLREQLGLSQKEAAAELGISNVHLCNIENGRAQPSSDLLAKYRSLWGVDLYVFAWCRSGDVANLPSSMQPAAKALSEGWQAQLDQQIRQRGDA